MMRSPGWGPRNLNPQTEGLMILGTFRTMQGNYFRPTYVFHCLSNFAVFNCKLFLISILSEYTLVIILTSSVKSLQFGA